jgi:hypothetical protein
LGGGGGPGDGQSRRSCVTRCAAVEGRFGTSHPGWGLDRGRENRAGGMEGGGKGRPSAGRKCSLACGRGSSTKGKASKSKNFRHTVFTSGPPPHY